MATIGTEVQQPRPISAPSALNNDERGNLKIATLANDDTKKVVTTTSSTSTSAGLLLPVVTPTGEPRDTIKADKPFTLPPPLNSGTNSDDDSEVIGGTAAQKKAMKPPPASIFPAPLPSSSANKYGGKKLSAAINATAAVYGRNAPILPHGGEFYMFLELNYHSSNDT